MATGPVLEVKPLDPFAYRDQAPAVTPSISASASTVTDRSTRSSVSWPGRSQLHSSDYLAPTPDRYQGLYFYRRDRLLQAGGWNNLEVQRPRPSTCTSRHRRKCRMVGSCAIFSDEPREDPKSRLVTTSKKRSTARWPTTEPRSRTTSTARRAFKEPSRARSRIVPFGRGVPPRSGALCSGNWRSLPGSSDLTLAGGIPRDDAFFDIRPTNEHHLA